MHAFGAQRGNSLARVGHQPVHVFERERVELRACWPDQLESLAINGFERHNAAHRLIGELLDLRTMLARQLFDPLDCRERRITIEYDRVEALRGVYQSKISSMPQKF